MVECESGLRIYEPENLSVLIDTWWNVNPVYVYMSLKIYPVLIDTWWNVNKPPFA